LAASKWREQCCSRHASSHGQLHHLPERALASVAAAAATTTTVIAATVSIVVIARQFF
jgi:hypothetical protein